MRKLLFAVLLVAAAASVTVPRLGDGDDLVLDAPADADAAEVQRAVEARLADVGEAGVERDGRRLALSPVDGSTRELVRMLASAFRLHVRPVDGTCERATRPDRTDPAAPVDLPVRPPGEPACLRLGPAVAGNDAIRRTHASGTNVVIRFADLPLETHGEWAVEVDGEVLTSPRVSEDGDAGVEVVVDARTAQLALALAAGLAHPLPGDLVTR